MIRGMDQDSQQLERPRSLTDLAEERLREMIVSGHFKFGEHLSEASLAAQLGISKTPVREALLRLRADGLIDIQPQRGTFVFSLSPQQVEEICGFRELLEVSALAFSMKQRHSELVAALEGNIRAMSLAQANEQWREIPLLDQEFHQVILDHCENAYLKQAYQLIASKIRALRSRLPEENERVGHCQENHAAIVRLIRAGDVARSQAALALHIRDTLNSYMEASHLGSSTRRVPEGALAAAARRVPTRALASDQVA